MMEEVGWGGSMQSVKFASSPFCLVWLTDRGGEDNDASLVRFSLVRYM